MGAQDVTLDLSRGGTDTQDGLKGDGGVDRLTSWTGRRRRGDS